MHKNKFIKKYHDKYPKRNKIVPGSTGLRWKRIMQRRGKEGKGANIALIRGTDYKLFRTAPI